MKKLIIFISLLSLSSATSVQQLFNIKMISVKKEVVEESRTYNGYAKIIDSKIYTITTTQDGFIKNLTAPNIYDKVIKGRKLFDIYSPKVYKAQIELISALSVSYKLAKNIETKLKLYDISSKNIRAIKRARRAFKYLPFYSPYSGLVVEKKVTEGSSIKKGVPIYKIADLSKVWVVGKAYEADRAYIQKGQKIDITFSGSSRVYSSTIDFIYPFVDPINKTIDFRATINNKNEKIQPNSYATIKSITSKKEILTLPSRAVITKGSKHLVFIPSEYEGEYKSKYVEAKRLSGDKFEIISGINNGDKVVNNSLFLLDSDVVINGED